MRARDAIAVSTLSVGDIVMVGTQDGAVYAFTMRDLERRYGILRVFREDRLVETVHATIMASRRSPFGSIAMSARICVGMYLEVHTHRRPDPEFVILEPLTVTAKIEWVGVNGDRVLPNPQEDLN